VGLPLRSSMYSPFFGAATVRRISVKKVEDIFADLTVHCHDLPDSLCC